MLPFMSVVRCEKLILRDAMDEGGGCIIGAAGTKRGRGVATATTVVNFYENAIFK